MDSIKAILPRVIKNIQKKQGYTNEDIESFWIQSVKKNITKHTRARFFKEGRLYINVENPAWLYELKINKEQILKKLNMISKNKIKEVSFRVGDIYGSR